MQDFQTATTHLRLIGFIQVCCFVIVPSVIALLLLPIRAYQIMDPVFVEGYGLDCLH